jgi:hypothetical protein
MTLLFILTSLEVGELSDMSSWLLFNFVVLLSCGVTRHVGGQGFHDKTVSMFTRDGRIMQLGEPDNDP